ncbi:MAG: hypothetical protein JJT76_11120 [Clostridiaceae bacterium]|nr:hypothetical protein [Clostridiaceae bacterium]
MKYFILMMLSVILIVGCETGDKTSQLEAEKMDFINQMKANEDSMEEYTIYGVYDFYQLEDPEERLRHINMHAELQERLNKSEWKNTMHYSWTQNGSDTKLLEMFDIKELPTFFVFDKKGIVLQTTNLDDIF